MRCSLLCGSHLLSTQTDTHIHTPPNAAEVTALSDNTSYYVIQSYRLITAFQEGLHDSVWSRGCRKEPHTVNWGEWTRVERSNKYKQTKQYTIIWLCTLEHYATSVSVHLRYSCGEDILTYRILVPYGGSASLSHTHASHLRSSIHGTAPCYEVYVVRAVDSVRCTIWNISTNEFRYNNMI